MRLTKGLPFGEASSFLLAALSGSAAYSGGAAYLRADSPALQLATRDLPLLPPAPGLKAGASNTFVTRVW